MLKTYMLMFASHKATSMCTPTYSY